jgi:outer membrane biosynthesis protein TonB
MPTLSASTPSDAPRPPWRGLALLTAAVAVVHLALLGVAPVAVGPAPSPLADKFITRTIVIAPPPAAEPPPQPTPTPEAAPAPARPKPVRPRAVAPPSPPAPEPAPAPEAENATPSVEPGRDLIAEAVIDAGLDTPAPAEAAAASEPAPVAQPEPDAAAQAADNAAANLPGSVPIRIPGSVRLSFAATAQQGASPLQGVFGELIWLQDGQKYDARLAFTFLFKTLRSQHSTGAIGSTGIEPDRFSDTRKTEVASHFVRDKGTVVFSNNTPSVPLLPGAQDRLSVVMQLSALLAGDPSRYPAGAIVAVQTVGPRDGEIWTFHVDEEEKLSLPAGEFNARKFTRNPRKPFDDKVELWISPDAGYLPVRIKLTQPNGDFADLQLRGIHAPG